MCVSRGQRARLGRLLGLVLMEMYSPVQLPGVSSAIEDFLIQLVQFAVRLPLPRGALNASLIRVKDVRRMHVCDRVPEVYRRV